MVDYPEVHRQARAVLDLLDRGIDTQAEVATLSVAQMQIVDIRQGALPGRRRSCCSTSRTASITDHEAAALFDVLRRLRAQGVAIVFVSHKLEEALSALRPGDGAARRQDRRRRRADLQRHPAAAGVADDRPRANVWPILAYAVLAKARLFSNSPRYRHRSVTATST